MTTRPWAAWTMEDTRIPERFLRAYRQLQAALLRQAPMAAGGAAVAEIETLVRSLLHAVVPDADTPGMAPLRDQGAAIGETLHELRTFFQTPTPRIAAHEVQLYVVFLIEQVAQLQAMLTPPPAVPPHWEPERQSVRGDNGAFVH